MRVAEILKSFKPPYKITFWRSETLSSADKVAGIQATQHRSKAHVVLRAVKRPKRRL